MTPTAPLPARHVVLVHGAWADGAGWKPVHALLTAKGYTVSVVQNPLTSFADDVAAVRRVLSRQPGPVVLVGHSYAGALVSEVGVDSSVSALVYIAAFVPDVGESAFGLLPKDGPPPPLEPSSDGFLFFSRGPYVAAFAGELPKADAEFMADSQVPISVAAGNTPLTNAAWKVRPSWYLVATNDHIIPPAAQRQMAARANATVTEAAGGHLVFISQPEAAVAMIEQAALGRVA